MLENKIVTKIIMGCPFCGSIDQRSYEIDRGVWAIYCVNCKMIGPHKTNEIDAKKSWAQRIDATIFT